MNPWKPTKIEWITFFALMPFIDVVLNYLFFGDRIWHDVRIWLYSFPIIYLLVYGGEGFDRVVSHGKAVDYR